MACLSLKGRTSIVYHQSVLWQGRLPFGFQPLCLLAGYAVDSASQVDDGNNKLYLDRFRHAEFDRRGCELDQGYVH
jgi:hypothetical protein